ncbi:type I-B CRISPR-associated protein Cas5b [Terrisporobacter sp.]
MRALRLDLFQETACYKKPFALKISETYPLPPYSTVNGMLHKLLDAKEYIPMSISIQGDYESIVNNYQTTYFYKKKEVTSMPMNQHMLLNVKIIIHINAEDEVLDKIYNSILNLSEYLSLGRKEDLVRIDNVRFVDVEEYEVDEDAEDSYDENILSNYMLKMPIYVPKEKNYDFSGINYRLNNFYIDKRSNWNKINTLYVEKDNLVSDGNIFLDDFYDLVCFNNI